jgi:hypothetical protein
VAVGIVTDKNKFCEPGRENDPAFHFSGWSKKAFVQFPAILTILPDFNRAAI